MQLLTSPSREVIARDFATVQDGGPGPAARHVPLGRMGACMSQGTGAPEAAVDAEVARRVLSNLRNSPFLQLRRLSCTASAGAVTLRGHLTSFYLTQLAQSLAASTPGVVRVDNQVAVVVPDRPPGTPG